MDGNLTCVAIQGKLEAFIGLEQVLQISSGEWQVNAGEFTPRKGAEASSGFSDQVCHDFLKCGKCLCGLIAFENPFQDQQRVCELRVPLKNQSMETRGLPQEGKLERQAGLVAMSLTRRQGFFDLGDGFSGFRGDGAWRVQVLVAMDEVEEGSEVFSCDSQKGVFPVDGSAQVA
ncbi:hypothetical protein TURU_014218 [Turdus rufiventris]|nr:hypothetical protein TURU_014218 [Turdus rufiventris]